MTPSPGLVVPAMESWDASTFRCDTVSYLNGKGEVSALKVLNQNNITGLDSVLGEMDASEADLMATATAFYFALYSQKKSNTINFARYDIFRK